MSAATVRTPTRQVADWRAEVARRCRDGARFAGLFASAEGPRTGLTAVLATPGRLDLLDSALPAGERDYPSLTAEVPAAFWYERAIHDMFGLRPVGHPRLDALMLSWPAGVARPRPGSGDPVPAWPDYRNPLRRHVSGDGVFTIPFGPVRSGVVETVEYLIETPGEDIPHVRVRPHYKHRGLERRFEGLDVATGVVLAERVEGIASVAHALAYAHAVEDLAGIAVPAGAATVRVVHAELERIANHLDVVVRLADAAALAVATARFGWHKERVMRLRSRLCGSRYGRGVVAVSGVHRDLTLPPAEVLDAIAGLERDVTGDERAAMRTASFLDRLRGTGVLSAELVREHGALGPMGRASGGREDVRASRPYDGYPALGVRVAGDDGGDVQARLRVRWTELHESFRLVREALAAMTASGAGRDGGRLQVDAAIPDGRAVGWAEAPQGEVLYLVEVADGRLRRVAPRSASFHNLVLLHAAFATDIFTDFAFIEASFGLSIAGVAL